MTLGEREGGSISKFSNQIRNLKMRKREQKKVTTQFISTLNESAFFFFLFLFFATHLNGQDGKKDGDKWLPM